MAKLFLENLNKEFTDTKAVDNLNLAINENELFVILGPTGAGKTSTLRLIAGLEQASSGSIKLNEQDISDWAPAQRNVSFVFQQYSLYPHLSVYDNLAFPLRSPLHKLAEEDIKKRIAKVSKILHIDHKLNNKATQLSGGEMQRVSIGRSLVRSPEIYLMDEPLSSLDAKLRAELRIEIKRIKDELNATMVYVTHDQVEAMTMADRIGILHEGKLVQVGTPQEIYDMPVNTYVASHLGIPTINLLATNLIPYDNLPSNAKTIGVRTEHLKIESTQEGTAIVEWIEHLGNENHLHLKIKDNKLVVLADPNSQIKVGDKISLSLHQPLFFDENNLRI